MILGQTQTLIIIRKKSFGFYLSDIPCDTDAGAEAASKTECHSSAAHVLDTEVLLPIRQAPAGAKIGDKISVFLYRDSEDRLIATTRTPPITLGKYSALTVKNVGRIGAFLDWGLEKDLLLPYGEQTGRVATGDTILVTLYIDKSGRLCAGMKGLYHLLDTHSPYIEGDEVDGRVYEFSKNFGTFVAVDDRYSAKILPSDDTSTLKIGDVIHARVIRLREDGKLDLTLRPPIRDQIEVDACALLSIIEASGGFLPLSDKSSPELILKKTQMSKRSFKRALGHLYKRHLIEIGTDSVRRI